MKKRSLKILTLVLTLAVVAVGSSVITLMLTDNGSADSRAITDEEIQTLERYSRLEEVRNIIKDYYYEEIDDETLVQGAIDGLLASTDDPYTFYYTAEEWAKLQEEMKGEYHGIGASVQMNETGGINVVRVFADSPAEKAGALPGDQITAIDDTVLNIQDYFDLEEAVALMRGEDNSVVTLTITRDGEEMVIPVMRGDVTINYVEYSIIEDNIGYLQLYQFEGNCAELTAEALDYFAKNNVKGIILDLRDNPGGLIDDAVNIADLFLPKGRVVHTEDRAGNVTTYYSGDEHTDIPLVVLINGNSASASEILSGALQDYERATLMGTQSFGKGIVQSVMSFGDGDGMQFTIARYYLPSGRCIHGEGIAPDIVVEMQENYDPSIKGIDLNNDNQLAAAIEELNKQIK